MSYVAKSMVSCLCKSYKGLVGCSIQIEHLAKEFLSRRNNGINNQRHETMGKIDKQHMAEYLKQMIKDKPKNEPIEKTLTTFCQRYSVSINECSEVYNKLVKQGEIKE
jgi:hypothetical protein